jgi:hypothetical protein
VLLQCRLFARVCLLYEKGTVQLTLSDGCTPAREVLKSYLNDLLYVHKSVNFDSIHGCVSECITFIVLFQTITLLR